MCKKGKIHSYDPGCQDLTNPTTEGKYTDRIIDPDLVVPEPFIRHLVRRPRFLRKILKTYQEQIQQLQETIENQGRNFYQCLQAVQICQEQTSKVLNQELQRHVLYPAIETVVTLNDELFRLQKRVQEFLAAENSEDPKMLATELQISVDLAREKLSYLDIERIAPTPNSALDPKSHCLCNSIPTDNPAQHGQIAATLTAGIWYRGQVLRPARVSVYRYTDRNKINE